MALYHKWDVKNDFAYVLQFFSLISDGLGSVRKNTHLRYLLIMVTRLALYNCLNDPYLLADASLSDSSVLQLIPQVTSAKYRGASQYIYISLRTQI